ncbi:hypothetical protein KY361_02535 [Candidatus Woesearchaeota archaeon]|nr:hypothetical protein [Candidatus Woesearchaeota archaeon]
MARQTAGSRLYTQSIISSEAMRKAEEYGISFRVSTADGRGPEANSIFFDESVATILDFVPVRTRPSQKQLLLPGFEPEGEDSEQEEHLLCMYSSPGGKRGYSRKGKIDAFGGLHKLLYPGFEYVDGVAYARATDEAEGLEGRIDKEGLFDIDGYLLTDKRYDSISRYETDLVKDVFLIKEGDRYGLLLPDGSLVGRENGMQEGEVSLKKFGEDICLHVQKDGKERYISWEGQEIYGGPNVEVKELLIGGEICGLAKNEQGQSCIFSRDNETLYGGWNSSVSEFKIGDEICAVAKNDAGRWQHFSRDNETIYGLEPCTRVGNIRMVLHTWEEEEEGGEKVRKQLQEYLLEKFDADGLLTVFDRAGKHHFGKRHRADVRTGGTMVPIDQEILMRFPLEEEAEGVVRYWRHDNTLAYGCPHEEELHAGEEGSVEDFLLSIKEEQGALKQVTVKKFRDEDKECYYSMDNIELFGGPHSRQTDYFIWNGDIYMGFQDEGGTTYHEWSGQSKLFGGMHPRVKGKAQMITFGSGANKKHIPILEVLEPVPFFSRRRLFGGRLRTPSTYYSLEEGERFESFEQIQKRYGVPERVRLEPLRRSDSVIMRVGDIEAAIKDPLIVRLEEEELEKRAREAEAAQKPTEEPGPSETEPSGGTDSWLFDGSEETEEK